MADYFVQMRRSRDYVPSQAAIRHVHAFLQLMAAMTGDQRYEEAFSPDMERRQVSMCEVLDRVENKGIERGESSAFGLVQYLLSNGRMEDLKKVSEDVEYRGRLMNELFPEKE